MLSFEKNVKAILESNFAGFKQEIINVAVSNIVDLRGFSNSELALSLDEARREGFEEGKTVGYNEAFIDCNHDGCQYCEFEDRNSFEFPCCDCRGSHDDLYRPIMEKVNEIRKYDICRYKETKGEAFCITHIYQEGTEKLFDAIYKDGAVVDYGALSSVERVGRIDSLDEWLQEG